MKPEDRAKPARAPPQELSGGKVGRRSTLRGDPAVGELAPSRLRWLLVLVPLLVIAGIGALLVARWTTPGPPPARGVTAPPVPLAPQSVAARPPSPAAANAPAPEASRPFDVPTVLSALPRADAAAGAQTFRICLACESDDRAGASRIGPSL